ncbi:MAG: DUF448 domain-containing protein [Ureaplasma sp.]|nr:DUF448 domain-containing protein [Ureaplasma sp.]
MKKKNFNVRMCILSHKRYHKNELIRLYVDNNYIYLDNNNKNIGKGFYFYPNNVNNINIIVNKLSKIFNKKLEIKDFNLIQNYINERGGKYEQEKK